MDMDHINVDASPIPVSSPVEDEVNYDDLEED